MKNKSVCVVHFGCAKNLIETEKLIGAFLKSNIVVTNNIKKCNYFIFNTCAFLSSARREVVEKIEKFKKINPSSKVILYGCLPQLLENSNADYEEIKECEKYIDYKISSFEKLKELFSLNKKERALQTSPSYAYLKISEGCDNKCSYCLIPIIKGPYKSFKENDILKEANNLLKKGVKEINIVSQDTAYYERKKSLGLIKLLEKILRIEGNYWLRLLYLHPRHITKDLIRFIIENERILNYLDIPLQHISDKILKNMRRKITKKEIYELFEYIRETDNNFAIRTTFILGSPGEEKKDIEEIKEFLKKFHPLYVGFFIYSPEPGTEMYKQKKLVPQKEITAKYLKELQELQIENMLRFHKTLEGRKLKALLDFKNGKYGYFRGFFQAPEVDTFIKVPLNKRLSYYDFYTLKIKKGREYELEGELAK